MDSKGMMLLECCPPQSQLAQVFHARGERQGRCVDRGRGRVLQATTNTQRKGQQWLRVSRTVVANVTSETHADPTWTDLRMSTVPCGPSRTWPHRARFPRQSRRWLLVDGPSAMGAQPTRVWTLLTALAMAIKVTIPMAITSKFHKSIAHSLKCWPTITIKLAQTSPNWIRENKTENDSFK